MSSTGKVAPLKANVKPMSVNEALEINKSLKQAASENDKSETKENKSVEENNIDSEENCRVSTAFQKGTVEQGTKKSTEVVTKSETGSSANVAKVKSRKHSKQNQSTNLMKKCIDCFQGFFHELVTQKFLKDDHLIQTCFGSILTSQSGARGDYLDKDVCNSCDNKESTNCDKKIIIENDNEEHLATFSTACQLLVEFASFPMYGQDSRQSEKQMPKGRLSYI